MKLKIFIHGKEHRKMKLKKLDHYYAGLCDLHPLQTLNHYLHYHFLLDEKKKFDYIIKRSKISLLFLRLFD